jgi:hypothetical protein
MTVEKLIEKLQEMPMEAHVFTSDDWPITDVEKGTIQNHWDDESRVVVRIG